MKQTKTSVIIYPRIAKLSAKTGKVPIYVRVLANAKKSEMRTNIDISVEEFNKWDSNMMRINDRFSTANAQINKIDMLFNDIINSMEKNNSPFSANHIISLLNRNKIQSENTILDFINEYYKKYIEKNYDLSASTKSNYRKAIRHIYNYLNVSKKLDMNILMIDIHFAHDFKNYLTNTNLEIGRKGMKESSASTVIKKFRTIFDVAVDKDIIKKNPFKKIKLKSKSTPKEKLTIQQVKNIKNIANLSEKQQIYRDIFLFSVYTGLSYIDAVGLTYKNICFQDNNETKLTIIRSKTSHPTEQYMVFHALEIIDKYKNDLSVILRKGLIPKKSNKEINLHLKIIAERSGIDFNLSHHIARHSYRQLLAEAGVEDIGVIKRMMGHSRENDIDSVYYSITDSRLLEAKKKFEIYLNNHLTYTNIHGK